MDDSKDAADSLSRHLTSATKSNGIGITMPYWDERVEAIGVRYPEVRCDKFHIDALAANFVLHPDRFDVIVASNLFGDILSDLGRPAPELSALRLRPILTPLVSTPHSSNRSMVPPQISPARALQIQLAKYGRVQ